MLTFVHGGPFVYSAAWKEHIGFYPISTAMEEQIAGLQGYQTPGKGTVRFPCNGPLPVELSREILAFRLREIAAEKAG